MIYRTEIRDKVVCEQAIEEKELCSRINRALKKGKFLLDKNDESSFATVDFDFVVSLLTGKDVDSIFVYQYILNNTEEPESYVLVTYLLEDIVRDTIFDIFDDIPETFVDYGDITSIEYEVE